MFFKILIPFLALAAGFPSFCTGQQTIYISAGTNLVANGNIQLVVNNTSFVNNGTFVPSTGTVSIFGNASTANSSIGGSSATGFNNLVLNKTANDALLGNNISIAGSLNMTLGNLQLNNFTADLGTTGVITGESTTSYITGTSGGLITRTATLNAPSNENPGNIGIGITSGANLGVTTITRGHVEQMVSPTQPSILRYYIVQPANNTGLNATVEFHYFDHELNAITETELGSWISSNGGATWSYDGSNGLNTTTNILTKTGLASLSRITLSDNPLVLAVRSIQLRATLVNNDALLTWKTIGEYNNHHFDIERSSNGSGFATIGTTPGTGNSNAVQLYTHTDLNPFSGITYYRIKQVDLDGRFSYSAIVFVNTAQNASSYLQVFPNPVNSAVNILFYSSVQKNAVLRIYDATGKLVGTKSIVVTRGINTLNWDLNNLSPATYLLGLDEINHEAIRVIKQ